MPLTSTPAIKQRQQLSQVAKNLLGEREHGSCPFLSYSFDGRPLLLMSLQAHIAQGQQHCLKSSTLPSARRHVFRALMHSSAAQQARFHVESLELAQHHHKQIISKNSKILRSIMV